KGSTATDTITVHSADGTPHQVTITVNGTNDKAVIAGTDSGVVTEESQLTTSGTLTVTDIDTGEAHFSNTDVVGTLGTLHLKDNGTWTYDLDNTNPKVQALGHGSNATDTITVQSADGTTHQVSITVNGTNDKAVIAGTDSGAVTEESQLQTSGTLTVTDVDTGEAHFSNTDVVGTLGTLHLKDNGAWTYDLDNTNPTVQALGQGKNATDTITVQSADGTTHQVSITVNGTNDKAVIAGTDSGAVTEESQLQTSGTLTLTDVDTGEAHFSNTDIKGSLGTLHLTDSGAWTYDLDNSNPAVQALAKGQHAKDIITVHSTDGTPHQVAITVNGTNDAAQITGTTTGAVTEDRIYGMQWLVVNSHMHVTDTDAGEAHFDPVLHAQNNAGIGYISTLGASVVIAPDGDWHYQLDNNIQQVQSLGQGQSYIDKVTVHTADGTTQELQITITGTNDAPTVTGSRVLPAGTEDQTLRITQTQLLAGATDIDKNDSGTLHVDAVTADHGTVTHNADGSFTFHPDQDYNGQVKFTYDIKDAHGGSVQATASSTLAAAGDAATISGVDTGDVHEGHTFTAPDGSMTGGYVDDRSPDHQHGNIGKLWNDEIHTDGHLSIVDADAGESYAQTGTYYGTHGRVILQTNGDWTYYASIGQDATGRAIDHLGKGESLTDTVTVKSADGTTHDIVVTIHGDNDRPYCSSEVQLNSGKEDLAQTITASELLANTIDVDANDTGKLMIANLHADHGSIQDNKDGTYTFTPTKDYNGQVHFTYDVQDAHGGVTHTGATASLSAVGDTAIIGGQDTFTVQEDHNLTLNSGNTIIYNGQLTITDADAGEDHFDGNLHQNQQTGTWDTGYTTQEGGKLILQSNGSYRYEIDNSLAKIQSLGSSETLIDTVTVRSADGTPHQIQVTIQGDNDAPVVSSAVTLAAGTEDTDVVLHASDLLANATDIDHDDAGKLSVANLIADHGTITDNHDGTFTFHPTQDYNGKVSFTYDVHDAHGGSVATSASITLAPTRDSAVITGTDTGTIIEDHNVGPSSNHPVAASGLLNVTDPDAGQDHFQVNRFGEQAIHDPFGGFLRITPSGAWGYEVANSRLQSLAEGEVEKVVYRVYSADHTAHDITITVTGTNDQPTITATTLAHGTEDTHYQMQASQFGFTDIDTGDTLHSIAITDLPPATQGKFVLDGHDITAGQQILTADISKLQFVPAQDFNGDVQFKYTVNDGHVDSQEATNTLHIDAVGDKAVIAGQDTGSLDEFGSHGSAYSDITDRSPDYHHSGSSNLFNQILSVTGDLTITDPDNNEAQFLSPAHQIRGQFGLLSISEQGHWVYQVSAGTSAAGRAIDKLGAGEKLTDTITIHSKDGTPHDIVITIHGDNDRPYCSSEVILNAGTEDTRQTLTTAQLLANTVDVDKNDAGLLTIENLHADHGSILNNADGTFTFTPEKDYNGDVHFSYDVKDAHGGVTHTGASTTLSAVGDAATIAGVDTGSITENTAGVDKSPDFAQPGIATLGNKPLYADGKLTITDPDVGEAGFERQGSNGYDYHGTYGDLILLTDGTWHYHADTGHRALIGGTTTTRGTAIDQLGENQSLTDTITIHSKDGTTHDIVITIHGSNDRPYCSSEVILQSGTEDTRQTITTAQLLANTVDVDKNDAGLLTIENLHADHGSILNNADGTFTFTPEKDYNGDVHFSYDVKDAHGGVTHTGATTSLSAVGDAAVIAGQDTGNLDEFGSHGSAYSDMTDKSPDYHHSGSSNLFNEILSVTGDLTITDPDNNEAQFLSPAHQIRGQFGLLSISEQGHWVYQVSAGTSAAGRAIDKLGAGQKLTDTITIHSKDGTPHDIVITIHGDNDRPYCSSEVILNAGTEDTRQTITTAQLLANTVDVDKNDAGLLTIENLHADHGSILNNADGTFTFTPEKDYNGDVHFSYDVKDAHGGVTHTGASTTLSAVGDAAVITGQDTGAITEDHNVGHDSAQSIQIMGSLTVTDPDAGQDHFIATNPMVRNEKVISDPFQGELHIDRYGNWDYRVANGNPTLQALKDGETQDVVYEVRSADGTTHRINITVTGTNDAPIVSSDAKLASGTEDTSITLTATQLLANASDVDHGETAQLSVHNLSADHGTVTDNKDGTYTFTPDKDYNGHVHFTYDVADRHGGIAHTGASTTLAAVNDASTLASTSGSVTEDQLSSSSNVELSSGWQDIDVKDIDSVNDADVVTIEVNGIQHKVPADFAMTLSGHYGTFTTTHNSMTGQDRWIYTVDNTRADIQGLSTGDSLQDTMVLITADGTRLPVTATIHGADDHVIIDTPDATQAPLGTVIEDTKLTTSGTLLAHDLDSKDSTSFTASNMVGKYGTLSVSSDGTWHYDLDPAKANVLSQGQRRADGFDITAISTDGSTTTKRVEVWVDGKDDAATIAGQDSGQVTEDTHLQTSGSLTVTDADTGEAHFSDTDIKGTLGTLHLKDNGDWTYDLDNNNPTVQALGANKTAIDDITVQSADGTSHNIKITIHGTDDLAKVTITDIDVTETEAIESGYVSSGAKPITGVMQISDIDSSSSHFAFSMDHGTKGLGTLTIWEDGHYKFDLDSAGQNNQNVKLVESLKAGEVLTDEFKVTTSDGQTKTIQLTIHGEDDQAVIVDAMPSSLPSTQNVTEDHTSTFAKGELYAGGRLNVIDADHGDAYLKAGDVTTVHGGHFHILENGRWSYTIDNSLQAVQQLSAGESFVEQVVVTSKDGSGTHTLQVTVNGTNDQPVLGVTQTTPTTGTLTETDVDVNDTHTFSVVSSTGHFGSLTVDPNTGDYVYTPNTSVAGMSYNAATNSYHGVDVFEVKVSDGQAEDSKFITFDASGHVTTSPTGGLVISTAVPQQPAVTAIQPTLPSGTNVAPTNTVTLDLASTSDSGSSNTDNLTNDTTPTITGHTDIPYSQVTVYDGSTPVGHAVSDASGQYSVAVSSLTEGDHNLSAKALAPSSVVPATSSLLSVHIDTQVHVGIQTDPVTADNVINAQESNSSINITGSVTGDFSVGDIVTLDVNGVQHTGAVDAKGHYSIAVPGSELIADADQKIEASIAVTDNAGNSAHATADVTYQVDTQVSLPTITFESAGADNLYSKAEIARGQANTITATVTPPGDAKIGEHLVVNGQDHVLDAHSLQHGIQIEVHPGSNVQATMTDEHGNTAGSQGFAASAIPEPIVVRPPSGSHQVSGTLGVPPLLPSLTPVPTAQSGWRIHLPNGQYVTSHHGQYGTLTIDPQTGDLHYQEQAQVHTGPHGSASGVGQHEDKFEVALQGTNQDEVVAHVNIQILSHGPGHSGKLTVGTEVVDMTITPVVHTSHPAPPPPPPEPNDDPDMALQADFTVMQSDDTYLDLTQHAHQEPDQKTSHHGAAAYLDALGIKPDATSATVHDQPADMDIVLAQVDQPDVATHDQANLDMSDALEHHDANINHNQDDEHHHHNDVDGLPDIDPNS
ncbi:VCBS domain-containing protein, partial [Vibrio vulnificus]|uniref:VCBS domain-containing protein n=1 Tax=Vibrio vulnificus TaxID=672 RepID=UPI003ED9521D